jgi:streptomycin 6-kinase
VRPSLTDQLKSTIKGVHSEQGSHWIEKFDELLHHCERHWQLKVLEQYKPSYHFVASVLLPSGIKAVLKLGVPGPELSREVDALRIYQGIGCAELYDADPERGIILLEQLSPGTTLHAVEDDEKAVWIASQVLQKITRPAPASSSFQTVQQWLAGLSKLRIKFEGGTGPLSEELVSQAEQLFRSLNASNRKPYLLHGDLHHGNILEAEREPWLAIDPKGVIGEAEYSVIPFLLNHLPEENSAQIIERRIHQFAKELKLNAQRMKEWTFCHAVLAAWWCIEDNQDYEPSWETAKAAFDVWSS